MPKGWVIKIVFRARVPYPEAHSICAPYGSTHCLNQRENSFLVFLEKGVGIDKAERVIARLKKNIKKVKDATMY